MARRFLGTHEIGSNEILDYTISYADTLAAESDSPALSSPSTWFNDDDAPNTATLGDGTNGANAPSLISNVAKVFVIAGAVGEVYHITNTLTTQGGRTYEGSIKITVVDK